MGNGYSIQTGHDHLLFFRKTSTERENQTPAVRETHELFYQDAFILLFVSLN